MALLAATLAASGCSTRGNLPQTIGAAQPATAGAQGVVDAGAARKRKKPMSTLTAIATTASYANGTISIVNVSGKTQDLSQIEVAFDDADPIASVWGTPWMAWTISKAGSAYTLLGGTPYAAWPNGAALTVSFTPPWNSRNAPSNVHAYAVPPAPLAACDVAASESGGTISIVNTSGAAIPLRSAQLDFTYAGAIGNVWGTPWMAWSVRRTGNAYVLDGGTRDGTALPAGQTLTAAFAPASGAHATRITFEAACGTPASPTPQPSATPVPSPTPTAKPTVAPTAAPTPTAVPTAPPAGSPEFIGFWESWSDTNASDAYSSLASVPATVTTTDVAFSIADDDTIAPAQNAYPLLPGAQAIHARAGKLLLSFGGATSQFAIDDPAQFVANLQAFTSANPGLYDGFDFDDEVMPWNGQAQLVSILKAVRAAFPHATITMDAFMSGADPEVALSTHQGEDIAILQQAGSALDYVNVMEYDQYGWVPTDHPNCSYVPGAADDCRLDSLSDFTRIATSGGAFPASKIAMGLMIGKADDGSLVTPANAAYYAGWVRSHGYRGIMIWDLDRDSPSGAGYPDGTYVGAISGALDAPAAARRHPRR